jgi:hypothetical protein
VGTKVIFGAIVSFTGGRVGLAVAFTDGCGVAVGAVVVFGASVSVTGGRVGLAVDGAAEEFELFVGNLVLVGACEELGDGDTVEAPCWQYSIVPSNSNPLPHMLTSPEAGSLSGFMKKPAPLSINRSVFDACVPAFVKSLTRAEVVLVQI